MKNASTPMAMSIPMAASGSVKAAAATSAKAAPQVIENHYHFDMSGAIITRGQKEIENMVVKAMTEASRKGRNNGSTRI
jgi:hypothetical protein